MILINIYPFTYHLHTVNQSSHCFINNYCLSLLSNFKNKNMLVIKSTKEGYELNQGISLRLFEPSGNTVVKVVCETPYYGEPNHLENAICNHINSLMPDGYTVKTNHVTLESSFRFISNLSKVLTTYSGLFHLSLYSFLSSVLRVNTSSRASFHEVRYTSFSARCAKAGLYLSAWQARRLIVSYHSRL